MTFTYYDTKWPHAVGSRIVINYYRGYMLAHFFHYDMPICTQRINLFGHASVIDRESNTIWFSTF